MQYNQKFFVDRQRELNCLKEAINSRTSLLISGPAGAGKTMLTIKALSELPESLRKNCLYVSGMKGLQDFFAAARSSPLRSQ
jgi:DNA replication protein DnaC